MDLAVALGVAKNEMYVNGKKKTDSITFVALFLCKSVFSF